MVLQLLHYSSPQLQPEFGSRSRDYVFDKRIEERCFAFVSCDAAHQDLAFPCLCEAEEVEEVKKPEKVPRVVHRQTTCTVYHTYC